MRDMVMKAGRANEFKIASCATSDEELGNPVHPGTKRLLAAHGIDCIGKTARQLKRDEYKNWDYIIGMDDQNISAINRIFKRDPEAKVHKLLAFANGGTGGTNARDIADPWYTGDFETTWKDIQAGCEGLLAALK